MNKKWSDTRRHVDEWSRNIDRNYLIRKASEELATLRDVHEGYQRYINTVEHIANDPQKLNLQIETNRVKLKGMNSYEARLSELKNLTKQIENRDLINDIENFANKWFETYSLISKLKKNFYFFICRILVFINS